MSGFWCSAGPREVILPKCVAAAALRSVSTQTRQLDLYMQSLRSRSASRSRSPSQHRGKSPRASSRSPWRSHWGTGRLDAERTWPTYNLDFRGQDKRPQPRDRSPSSPSSPSSRFTFTGPPGGRQVLGLFCCGSAGQTLNSKPHHRLFQPAG